METAHPFDRAQEKSQSHGTSTVIALHCSGAGGGMWQHLRDRMEGSARLLTPDLYGAAMGPAWAGDRAFSLSDEAAPIVGMIDAMDGTIHLVGHSYGGAVALNTALARPERVASLTLYEPAAFHLLQPADGIEYAEITWLARDVEVMIARGDLRGAMKRFVNYWGGNGTWDAMAPEAKAALQRWAPKATLDFRALLGEPARAAPYEGLYMPCRILVGSHSPSPTGEIADILGRLMPDCSLTMLENLGHMAPFTHGGHVADLIAGHLQARLQDDVAAPATARESGCAA